MTGPIESQARAMPAAVLKEILAAKPPNLHLLDVRSRQEYEKGHVPGSLHCPVHDLSRRVGELPPRVSTVLVIGDPGRRSQGAAVFLLLAGFSGVAVLEGGWPAWDGPAETGPGTPLSSAHPPLPPGWVDPPAR